MKTVTVIGGGTGTFVVLSGLKQYPIDLGVIVNMMDSGGNTGRLRDQLGVLPPGDLRQCLVAMSEAPLLWRKLFLYRFETGDLEGYNFGNIFISALEKNTSSYDEVLELASYVLKTKGKVIPVTYTKAHLCVRYENGKILKGEKYIDENLQETSRIEESYLEPGAKPNSHAVRRIENSDFLIVGPGDLYTSIFPVVLVDRIKDSVARSKAKIIYIMNLMTKSGQTTGYKASDHLKDFVKYFGKIPDYIVINDGQIPPDILQWYLEHKEKRVENDLSASLYKGVLVKGDIVDNQIYKQKETDSVTRSILRHNSKKLADILADIISC